MVKKLKSLFRKEKVENENITAMKELYKENEKLLSYLINKNMEGIDNAKTRI